MKSLLLLNSLIIILVNVKCKSEIVKSDWSGKWRGMIHVYPKEFGPTDVQMTLELGPFPTVENNCSLWRGTYTQEGKVVVVKDYRLCRRNSDEDLFVDERNGIILDVQWIGGELFTPYKFDKTFYIVINRLRGDTLEEDIITVGDENPTEGVQPLRTRVFYRTRMKRI